MAILQISQIQVRRGLEQDLPQLAGGELGWSQDARRLYIGNGTLDEGAPVIGQTEILTEFSVLNITNGVTGNITAIQSNIVAINSQLAALIAGGTGEISVILNNFTSGPIISIPSNNAIITYTLSQGTKERFGTIKMSRSSSNTVSYDEEYTETTTPGTDISFNITSNTGYSTLNYSTTTLTSLLYKVQSL
jgi:hypothetical protein